MGDVLIFDSNVVASQGSPQIRLIHSTLFTMAIPLAAGAVWAFPLIFSGFIGKDFRWISKTLLEIRKLIALNENVRSLIVKYACGRAPRCKQGGCSSPPRKLPSSKIWCKVKPARTLAAHYLHAGCSSNFLVGVTICLMVFRPEVLPAQPRSTRGGYGF